MDVVAHLNLKAHLLGVPVPFNAASIERLAAMSERQKTMGQAERAEEAYWVAGKQ
jgi:exoribonuclease R